MHDASTNPSRGDPVVTLERLEVGHAGRALLPPIDLDLHRGEVWGVVGPNGCGKTTLLRTILGLHPPIGGNVRWSPGARPAVVPQRRDETEGLPHRVVDIVRAGIDRGWSFLVPRLPSSHRAEVDAALESTGTAELAHHDVSALSDGQRQRVAIASALVSRPGFLALDEPTSAMDQANEREIMRLIGTLADERAAAVLVIGHHLAAIAQTATHLLALDRDRQVVASGPADALVDDPRVKETFGLVLSRARRAARDGEQIER